MLDEVEDVTYYVTGLPAEPKEPYNYKLVFSPDDLSKNMSGLPE